MLSVVLVTAGVSPYARALSLPLLGVIVMGAGLLLAGRSAAPDAGRAVS